MRLCVADYTFPCTSGPFTIPFSATDPDPWFREILYYQLLFLHWHHVNWIEYMDWSPQFVLIRIDFGNVLEPPRSEYYTINKVSWERFMFIHARLPSCDEVRVDWKEEGF